MAVSLNALTLRINANTEGMAAGVRAVRSDVNKINRLMRATASDTDKARDATASLNRVRKTGALSSAEYARGLEAINKKYKETASSSKAWTRGVIAASAAMAAFVYQAKRSFDSVDKLAKTADKLGVTTEALTSLRFAAEETGVASNTLDMALQRMVRRVSEASKGTGEAVKALKELGINAQQLARLSPDEQFKVIADAMGRVESEADKVRLAFKLFDSEGVALVNTLKLGSEGLTQYEQDAKELGITVSRFDAAKIEEANDAIGRLKFAFAGFATQMAGVIAPAITGFVTKILEVRRAFSLWVGGITAGQRKMLTFIASFTFFITIAPRIITAIKGIIAAVKMWRNAQIALLAFTGPKGWAQLALGLAAAGATVMAVESAFADQNETLSETAGRATAAANAMDEYGMAANRAANAGKPADSSLGSSSTAQEEINRLREQNRLLEFGAAELQRQKMEAEGITTVERFNLEQLRKRNDELKRSAKHAKEARETEKKALEARLKWHESEAKSLQESARRVTDEFASPFQRLVKDLAHLNQLRGIEGGLSQKVFGKAVRARLAKHADEVAPSQTVSPPSISRQSREEYQLLAKANNKAVQDAAVDRKLMIKEQIAQRIATERGNAALESSAAELAEILSAIREMDTGESV